jgi:hypothetical protein
MKFQKFLKIGDRKIWLSAEFGKAGNMERVKGWWRKERRPG